MVGDPSCSSCGPLYSIAWGSSRILGGTWLPPEPVIGDTRAEATMPLMTEPQESHARVSTIFSGVHKPAPFTVGEDDRKVCLQEAENTGCRSFPSWSTFERAMDLESGKPAESGMPKFHVTAGELPVRVGNTAPWGRPEKGGQTRGHHSWRALSPRGPLWGWARVLLRCTNPPAELLGTCHLSGV